MIGGNEIKFWSTLQNYCVSSFAINCLQCAKKWLTDMALGREASSDKITTLPFNRWWTYRCSPSSWHRQQSNCSPEIRGQSFEVMADDITKQGRCISVIQIHVHCIMSIHVHTHPHTHLFPSSSAAYKLAV